MTTPRRLLVASPTGNFHRLQSRFSLLSAIFWSQGVLLRHAGGAATSLLSRHGDLATISHRIDW
jgi:hypothetical protein